MKKIIKVAIIVNNPCGWMVPYAREYVSNLKARSDSTGFYQNYKMCLQVTSQPSLVVLREIR